MSRWAEEALEDLELEPHEYPPEETLDKVLCWHGIIGCTTDILDTMAYLGYNVTIGEEGISTNAT